MGKAQFQNELFDILASSSEKAYFFLGDMMEGSGRWSPSAVDFFGMSGEYLDNVDEEWIPKIHPDDVIKYTASFSRMIRGEDDEHLVQYRVKNKHDKYIWVECRGRLMKDVNGGPGLFAGVITCLDNRNKYDALTGVYTTHEFYNRDLTGEEGHFLLLGLDDFRNIISSYGYTYADSVLVEIARRLEEITKNSGSVYRFSGDEFIIVYAGTSQYDIYMEFNKIKSALTGIGEFKGHLINLSVTAGAIYYPMDNKDIEDYINDLEKSLEIAKSKYRGSVVFYSDEVAALQQRKKLLRDDLMTCVRSDFKGFELYYQPLVDANTEHIAGCESLLRWKGDVIKDSNPGEFIPILEDIGLIREVGSWVMEEAVTRLGEWEQKYGNIKVSFNISYRQFLDEKFADQLIRRLEEADITPANLIAELTESCKVENPASLAEIFECLRDIGVQVALDDFGTAYASMELLKVLPANYIKVDQMFVREIIKDGHEIDYAIIDNILSLCEKLGYTSVVEGVENEDVKNMVKKLNPKYLQGYCYSRPVCRADFERLLDEDRHLT